MRPHFRSTLPFSGCDFRAGASDRNFQNSRPIECGDFLFSPSHSVAGEEKKEGGRRETLFTNLRTLQVRRAPALFVSSPICGRGFWRRHARLPASYRGSCQGVCGPLMRSGPGFVGWARHGRCPPSPAHYSDAPRTPVVMPAGMMPGPPGNEADEASPAGTALAPKPAGVTAGRPRRGARFDSQDYNQYRDRSQYLSL
jgi:hypothetical protein